MPLWLPHFSSPLYSNVNSGLFLPNLIPHSLLNALHSGVCHRPPLKTTGERHQGSQYNPIQQSIHPTEGDSCLCFGMGGGLRKPENHCEWHSGDIGHGFVTCAGTGWGVSAKQLVERSQIVGFSPEPWNLVPWFPFKMR